jgi:hypothetical protein
MITLVSSVNDSDHLFTMLEYSFTIVICLYTAHRFNLICITSTKVVTANASTAPVKFGFSITVQFKMPVPATRWQHGYPTRNFLQKFEKHQIDNSAANEATEKAGFG